MFQEALGVGEADDAQLSAQRVRRSGAFQHRDGAVGRDVDVMIGRLEHDRPAGAENRVARGRHELARVVEMQAAVAGVAFAARRLHRQVAATADGDVQRVFGLLERALGLIAVGAAILDVADAAVAAHEIVFVRARRQIFLEQGLIGLEACGVDVGDVVGNDVELPLQHRLPRKSDEKRVLHRWFSPG